MDRACSERKRESRQEDVARELQDALAIARGRQENKEGWVEQRKQRGSESSAPGSKGAEEV